MRIFIIMTLLAISAVLRRIDCLQSIRNTSLKIATTSNTGRFKNIIYLLDATQTNMKWMINFYSMSAFLPSSSDTLDQTKFPSFGMGPGYEVGGYVSFMWASGGNYSAYIPPAGQVKLFICTLGEWTTVSFFASNCFVDIFHILFYKINGCISLFGPIDFEANVCIDGFHCILQSSRSQSVPT
jgi:hypothetical protein